MDEHQRPHPVPRPEGREPAPAEAGAAFQHLLALMAELRDPERGCPWTRAQTFETILPYTVEEVYEVVDAIRAGDMEHLCDELGDLLLQVIYHARMAEEAGSFSAADVIAALIDKLVRRHPHVFEREETLDPEAVMRNWERIKEAENARHPGRGTVLGNVLRSGPALVRARKLQEAVVRVVSEDRTSALEQSTTEIRRSLGGLPGSEPGSQEAGRAIGDALFALVRLARAAGVEPEVALDSANARFQQRVTALEQAAGSAEGALRNVDPDAGSRLWSGR